MSDVLAFFGGSVIGAFIGYFIKHYLDLRYSKKIEEMNRKRKIYEEMIDSLNVFISGRNTESDLKNKFLEAYARLWLWASDDVIREMGFYLDNQINLARGDNIEESVLKESYTKTVLEMRKDLGYTETTLDKDDYKFVSFK